MTRPPESDRPAARGDPSRDEPRRAQAAAGYAAARRFSSVTCVVTGGLGFIGSNVVHRLVEAGARVRIVDELVPEHGGRLDNVAGLPVEILQASIGDARVADVLDGADLIINAAGQVSHIASMRDPQQDLRLNATSHAEFLEMLRRVAPDARVVHTSTRQVYGRPIRTPVDETHPAHPVDVNGVAKLAGERLHMVYSQAYGLPITSLRLTNVYGPRQRLTSDELGFLPVFIRNGLLSEPIELFGDGEQRRDCLHVDDVVCAMTSIIENTTTIGQVYNVGHTHDHSLREIASAVIDVTRSTGGMKVTSWPDDHARVDIGSVHLDGSKMAGTTGWVPAIDIVQGLRATAAFYRGHPCYLSST
jgi:UDP-glucose 4-epimerase